MLGRFAGVYKNGFVPLPIMAFLKSLVFLNDTHRHKKITIKCKHLKKTVW